jgi:hypothetical protein
VSNYSWLCPYHPRCTTEWVIVTIPLSADDTRLDVCKRQQIIIMNVPISQFRSPTARSGVICSWTDIRTVVMITDNWTNRDAADRGQHRRESIVSTTEINCVGLSEHSHFAVHTHFQSEGMWFLTGLNIRFCFAVNCPGIVNEVGSRDLCRSGRSNSNDYACQ